MKKVIEKVEKRMSKLDKKTVEKFADVFKEAGEFCKNAKKVHSLNQI